MLRIWAFPSMNILGVCDIQVGVGCPMQPNGLWSMHRVESHDLRQWKTSMNVAIVTARAGSKSIIDKNVLPLRGKPMVQYPIHAAQAAKRISSVWVSTDGEAIAKASTD